MITVGVLICLITLTSQLVYSKVITINITSGNSSRECCTEERCMCVSLSVALHYIDSNTTINIISSPVILEESVKLGSGRTPGSDHTSGSGNLTNITITGSNVTIMCNNSGSVYCESCNNVIIEGITWDRCGSLDETNTAGVTFNGTSNVSLVNCIFQHSQRSAVNLLGVSDYVNVNHCSFLSNKILLPLNGFSYGGVLNISNYKSNYKFVYLNISDSYFYANGRALENVVTGGYSTARPILSVEGTGVWNVSFNKTTFSFNKGNLIGFFIYGNVSVQLRELDINNNNEGSLLEFKSVTFNILRPSILLDTNQLHKAEILITNSSFTNNYHGSVILTPSTFMVLVTLVDVEISHNTGDDITLIIAFLETATNYKAVVKLTRVNVMSNKYLTDNGGAVYIEFSASNQEESVLFEECEFFNNTSTSNHGAALYVTSNDVDATITIMNSKIHHNHGGYSVIYSNNMNVAVDSSNFTDNIGSCIYLVNSYLLCAGTVMFAHNTADNGAALYIEPGSIAYFDTAAVVQFINNSATQYGGAIDINLLYNCPVGNLPIPFYADNVVSFVNNTAEISGNSLFFYIPTHCKVETNISNGDSILYTPCHFNYYQPINGTMTFIPCDLDYTLLNGTGPPIVTSPHELRLYFPFSDGYNISSTSDHNVYLIRNNILGYPVEFAGKIFDYFGKPAQPTQFDVQCVNCSSSIALHKVHFIVDNVTSLSITFTGAYIENKVNVNVTLISIVYSIKQITVTLVVELMPCIDHPGYTYSTAHKACVCYHHNVDCHDSYNEIKRGYWFGSVSNTATTAPCHHYCKFTGRTETRQGYFVLPSTIDGQCNDHRVRRACGECSSGYTLSYDSTDCISVDQCGAGWTVLVITLTCLYWIAIVAGVFALMYFTSKISLGYLYGLIYYYSIVRILLDNNPNLSNGVFQFASVLSSFAQLTPQFLGELCLVEDLSGINQLFIHYSHAIGISLLLLLIVVAARCSARITLFVSHCIIRVICLLILLSYTSIASTSLQLLQPLRFTDVKEWYTYTSPKHPIFSWTSRCVWWCGNYL